MQPLVHLALVVVQLLFASLALNSLLGGRWVRDRRDLLRLAILGMLGIAANQTLFLYGLKYTTAINATILVTTVPVFTVLGSVLIGREPPSALKFAGIGLAGIGAIYLIGPDRISLAPEVALGNALIVLGMVCYAAYFLYSKPMLQRYGSVTVSFYVMFFAYLLNLWALKRASSNLVAVYIYLQPLFAAAVAPLVLRGERLTGRAVLAGLAIFAGLALVIWPNSGSTGRSRPRRWGSELTGTVQCAAWARMSVLHI